MYFWKYRLRQAWLDKCLTSRVSEHPSKDTMGDGSIYCCNLKDSTSTKFSNRCEGNYVLKSSF